jgi:DNA mismatch repair protein MutS
LSERPILLAAGGTGGHLFPAASLAQELKRRNIPVELVTDIRAEKYGDEFPALADKLPHAANATVEVKEWQDEIVFLYRVVQGAADRSYGIHVAKLAGLPGAVLARAGEVLTVLEKADGRPKPADLASDLPLFSVTRKAADPGLSEASLLEAALAALRPDAMTPKEALEALYRLKELLERASGA